MRRHPAAIRPVFRVLAGILGPPMMIVGVAGPAAIAWTLIQSGGKDWMEWTVVACGAAVNLPIGFRLLQAARTGRDPYAGKTADELALF